MQSGVEHAEGSEPGWLARLRASVRIEARPLPGVRTLRTTLRTLHVIAVAALYGGHVYGVDSYGELRCLDLKTGDRIWEYLDSDPKYRWYNIHMVRHEDKI